MRQIYTSPRPENIDRVVALLAEHGIETSVTNRSNYNRQSYQRFSYSARQDSRDSWPQVWITKADDHTRARALLATCRTHAHAPEDLYDVYRARIDYFELEPPDANWKGVYVAGTK